MTKGLKEIEKQTPKGGSRNLYKYCQPNILVIIQILDPKEVSQKKIKKNKDK